MEKNKDKKAKKLKEDGDKTDNIKKNITGEKKCEKDKILNPSTKRCVLKNGKIGRNIIKGKSLTKEREKTEKKCEQDKILNIKTQRCVKKKGIMGKKILQENKVNIDRNEKEIDTLNVSNVSNDINFDLLNKKYTNKTKYEGYAYIEYNAILYLLKRHKSCTTLVNKINVNKIKFIDFQLRWMCDNNERILSKPKYFGEKLKNCYNTSSRFIFVLLSMTNRYKCSQSNNQGHLNVIIYDKIEKSLERFEPMGIIDRFEIYSKHLDNIILDLFRKYLPVSTYFSPLDFCPASSFQCLEIKSDAMLGDPGGFCSAWSLWYLDLRLSNPTLSRNQIVSFALNQISLLGSFKNFIRNYSHFLYSQSFD